MKKIKNSYFKKVLFLTFFMLFFSIFLSKSSIFEEKDVKIFTFYENEQPFKNGEHLKYKISYGKAHKNSGVLLAGHAEFTLNEFMTHDSILAYEINGFGKSTKFFSLFMHVKHSYRSVLNQLSLNTIESSMDIVEGKYKNQHQVTCNEDSTLKNGNINDILGAFYKLRATQSSQMANNDTIFFSYYYNEDIYHSHFIKITEEVIDTKFGKINTIKCAPLLEKGRMFKQEYGAFVWVTADEMHIPVKLEIPILVGSIYVTLTKYKNTRFNIKE